MLRVTQLRHINASAPVQWQGQDADGRPVYARYSNGRLSVSVGVRGDSIFSAVYGEVVFAEQVGAEQSNEFDLEQMKAATAGFVEWPERES
jgi:hypothetical protein